MHNNLLDIALKGLKGKKMSSIYLLLVCFLSVTFAVLNVSITGSLNKTREELRYTMYGEWDIAVYSQEPLTAALQDDCIQEYGIARLHGNLMDQGETVLTGIGTLDESLRTIGRLEMLSGTFPTKDNEIAIEADTLSNLGYDYELGQTLNLRIMDKNEKVVTKEYILCGVLREYTGLWNNGNGKMPLVGACVTESAAEKIGSDCSYLYFLRAEKEKSYELYRNLEESYESTVENTPITETAARNEYHFFNLALILITTIAAVIVIYSIQMKGQMRSMQLFRIIGVTKKQLSVIIFYETMLILLPALVCGIAAGILSTWIVLRVLMEQSVSLFYISIPMMFIIGILLIWFGSVFGVRFLIFCYFLRGNLSARKRLRSWGRQERQKRLGILLLSSAGILAVIFCYGESLVPVYTDAREAEQSSYVITCATHENLFTDAYVESTIRLPGIEEVIAWRQMPGTLYFSGAEENPFASLLREHFYGARIWDIETDENVIQQTVGPDGMWCYVYGIAEDNWNRFFQYVDGDIDKQKFKNGETVLLYIPYNTETGVELGGELYQDFGVAVGDIITVNTYGRGELSENGSMHIWTEDGNQLYEPYEELKAVSWLKGEVAGIITADLWQDPYLMVPSNNYYAVIASNAFIQNMTETERDGIALADGSWSNQESGYSYAAVYTGMDAGYLSTDYLMAKSAAEHHVDFANHREEHTAYRQEAIQALLHLWICGICVFLILILIQLNIEMLHGLTRKRTFALQQVMGMSKRRIRIHLAVKGVFISVISCLLAHMEYFLYFVIKHVGTYHRYITEFDYTGTFGQLLKDQFTHNYMDIGWSLPVYLAFCFFGMVCVFLLFFCPQNRVLKENIRESLA